MRKLEIYRFREGITPLGEAELNLRFFDVDLRLHALELLKVSWEDATREISNASLDRINSIFMPMLEQLTSETQATLIALQEATQAALDQVNELLQQLEGGLVDVSRLRGGDAVVTYNPDSTVQKITYSVPTGTFEMSYTYVESRVSVITATLNGEALWTRTYQYDQNGNLTNWTEE